MPNKHEVVGSNPTRGKTPVAQSVERVFQTTDCPSLFSSSSPFFVVRLCDGGGQTFVVQWNESTVSVSFCALVPPRSN